MKNIIKNLLAVVAIATAAISATATDRFYVEDFEIMPGETKSVSVMLVNNSSYTGFQCDILMPDGLTADNWSLTDRASDQSFSSRVQEDGALRIVCISMTSSLFEGNEGALLTFDVTASENLRVGSTHTITVANTAFAKSNGAFVNFEDEENTTTIVAPPADRFYIEDFELAPGETQSVSVILDNKKAYTGFQSDIYLPEGITAANWRLTARATDQTIMSKVQSDGALRIVCISMTSSLFEGSDGALLTFDVTADKSLEQGNTLSISVANTAFAQQDGSNVTLEDEECVVTVAAPPTNRFYIEDFEIEAGVSEYQIGINLDNLVQFTGFTADLILPEGMTAIDYMVGTSRNNMHTYTATTQGDGIVKLSASSNNKAFAGYEGELVYIYVNTSDDFAGTHTIQLQNIVFTDTNGTEHNLVNSSCVVTVLSNTVELMIQDSYYNNLTLYLPKGVEQMIKVSPTDVYYMLNTVLFNGEDVTNELVGGVYITPKLNENSVINISFEIPTAENAPMHNSRIKAYGHRGDVVVAGCERGESIAIYDVDGVLLRTIYATSDTMRIAMPTDAVYVVKVADAAVKVAL